MNHYQRHTGDYLKKTIGLTMLQDGAYGRMIDLYYIEERPLPSDRGDLYSALRCGCKADREAVEFVLRKYFQEKNDGFHNDRCDEELEIFREAQVDSDAKREHEKERQKRARERRRKLFSELRGLGITPPWDSSTGDLEALLSRSTTGERTQPVTRDESVTYGNRTPADTANHKPLTSNQGSTKDQNLLSGSPPDVAPKPSRINGEHRQELKQYRADAVSVIEFLNAKTGRAYEHVSANVDPIVSLFKQGATLQKVKQVIAKKAREWRDDPKMEQYIRPKTLFSRTNFANYAGEIVDVPTDETTEGA